MNRRLLLIGIALSCMLHAVDPAYADGDSGNSGSGSGNSGSGSGNSGSGSGNSGSGSDNSGPGNNNDDNDGNDENGEDDWDGAAEAAGRGDITPLHSILDLALANTPGKVIDVKLNRSGQNFTYRVKILAATGRKVVLSIDARTRNLTRIK